MWRLILVTFGFMAWAFYELSGGAGYQPAAGSRQHAAAISASQPETAPAQPAPVKRLALQDSGRDSRVVLASAQTAPARINAPVSDAEKRLRLTLNAVRQNPDVAGSQTATAGVATVAADPDKIARLVAAAGAVRPDPKPAAEAEVSADTAPDLRKVKGSRVNMRQGPGTDFNVVARLTQGAEVEVLRDNGDGWVKLRVGETGQVGWMADFLLIAVN